MIARDWWKSAVVYQIYPRSFADANGDGIGDLRGIIDRLDHLADLGVDVVWLSPVYRSPMDDNGYDISDYEDIDPLFGTLADMDELVAQAHSHGIKIVMDLVVNHTSDEHAWFEESRRDRDNPQADWYIWRDPRPGNTGGEPGAEPNNWGSFFSGSAWEWEPRRGQYFLHLFSRKQPDLNWENPEVRQAVYAMMNRWLDRGVDGFRMDVINLISKRSYDDGPVPPGLLHGSGFDQVACGPRLLEFLQEMHAAVFAERPAGLLTVGEMPGVTVDLAADYTDAANQALDMVFQFEHVELDSGPGGKWDLRPLKLSTLKASLGRWQAGLAERGWNSLYWDNHDQPRAVSRFGDDSPAYRVDSAKALMTVLHLHRGTPYVYQGEELGMTNYPFGAIADFSDLESVNHFHEVVGAGADPEQVLAALRTKGRDNARTPMQWDDCDQAGFTTGTPWLAVNPNYRQINAAAQRDDPESVFAHTKAVIALRHADPVVAHGDFTMLLPDGERVYAFERRLDGARLLVVANLSSDDSVPAPVPELAEWAAAEVVLASGPGAGAADGEIVLGPWQALVLRR
ncbi:alpha-glucosidase [Nostocoides veronense]|uniref:Alpha-glucosidase n=1 Tax=Nostocoides veronense TaxID=330836 RepID=A0ABN2LC41_9MICO